jgi:hypothetical protein
LIPWILIATAKIDRFVANRVQAANSRSAYEGVARGDLMVDFSFRELIAIATALGVTVGVIDATIFATTLLRRK